MVEGNLAHDPLSPGAFLPDSQASKLRKAGAGMSLASDDRGKNYPGRTGLLESLNRLNSYDRKRAGGVRADLATVAVAMYTIPNKPSDDSVGAHSLEAAGRLRYIANGCTTCATRNTCGRRIGARGRSGSRSPATITNSRPHLLGSETGPGPDLSQEGGEHPDAWQYAHLIDPDTPARVR